MASSISPVLADLVMAEIEEKAITTALSSSQMVVYYVDESHACLKKDQVDEFHQHLNSINANIQFTLELENAQWAGLTFPQHHYN